MPNPKKKHTRHRTGIRRGHNFRMEAANNSACPNCSAPRLPHRACGSCGFYAGRAVLSPKKTKKEEPPAQPQ